MRRWLQEIDRFVFIGKTACYAEEALNELMRDVLKLHAVYFSDEVCMEIDDTDDLALGERMMSRL